MARNIEIKAHLDDLEKLAANVVVVVDQGPVQI